MDFKSIFSFLLMVSLCAGAATKKAAQNENAEPAAGDDSDMYMEPLEEEDAQVAPSSFEEDEDWSFGSYDQPSGHSRPIFYNTYEQQEGAYSQRNDPPYQQDVNYDQAAKYNAINKEVVAQPAKEKLASILGDGNFGIIKGGTFYPEKKNSYEEEDAGPGYDDFSSYFRNGHGRPSYYKGNPKPGKKPQQFENFRDFADINSPPQRQYSEYVVVYTNKNGTRTGVAPPEVKVEEEEQQQQQQQQQQPRTIVEVVKRPRNILESLAMLDAVQNSETAPLPEYDQGDVIDIAPEKKLSKSKRKLALLLPEKKHEERLRQKDKDMREPLLALS